MRRSARPRVWNFTTERGRIYLPANWLAAEGVVPDEVHLPDRRAHVFRVVGRLLSVSDGYYHSASAGIARLPGRSAFAVATARRVYRGIGDHVRTLGAASWNRRIATSRGQKLTAGVLAAGEVMLLRSLAAKKAVSRDGLWTPDGLGA